MTNLLSLPNEILVEILRLQVPLLLNASHALRYPNKCTLQYEKHRIIHNVRLVNRRFAQLGRLYLKFRHNITGERQLREENAGTKDNDKIYGIYTRQLDVDGLPVLYWIDTLRAIYPAVTHLTLTNVRTSSPSIMDKCVMVLDSVQHLSVHVTALNENGIPNLLRTFPNLVTLSLDSDSNSYKGMDTNLLLSCPLLPKLRILHRPPLKRLHLSFQSQHGYCNLHYHDAALYDPSCLACSLWLSKVEATEQIMATQLAQRYPYLQQILVPRVILEDSVPISLRSPQFDTLTPGPDLGEGVEEESWMELLRKRLDVAIWVVEEESHEGCQPDCLWRFDQSETKDNSITITTEVEQSEPTKPPELTCHIENSCAHKRKPFRVVQPVDYNEHNQFKHKPELLPWDEYPKFWWSRSQRTRVDRTRGGRQTVTLDAPKLLYYKKSGNKSKLFNAWDL